MENCLIWRNKSTGLSSSICQSQIIRDYNYSYQFVTMEMQSPKSFSGQIPGQAPKYVTVP